MMMNWEPIDTLPPGKQAILYYPAEGEIRGRPGQPKLSEWITIGFPSSNRHATHWMPLPAPPKENPA